jgi:adenine-specific DNA-methyltransferase
MASIVYMKYYENDGEGKVKIPSILDVSSNNEGKEDIKRLFHIEEGRDSPVYTAKPVALISFLLGFAAEASGVFLDFFGGSGTTAHAVINLNREDNGSRKYILVEQGAYFDTVLKPRIQKVIYAAEWKDGKPVEGSLGSSHCFQYLRLESYEDTLDNLDLKRPSVSVPTLFAEDHDEYLLKYMLDHETREARLNVAAFATPFDYKLRVRRNGVETQVGVDLVETANYLLGLTVTARRALSHQERAYRVVEGTVGDDSIVVIWRNTQTLDLTKEAAFVQEKILTDHAVDRVYINGDSHVPNASPIETAFVNAMR